MENRKELTYCMYGLVPYQLSGIQKGIQYGHAVVEYGLQMSNLEASSSGQEDDFLVNRYKDWADNWKTFIILNGGTTNSRFKLEDGLPFGTLNQHVLTLSGMGIDLAIFKEPDLGDQLTAVVFIVDERVFNEKKYPKPEDFDTDSNVRKAFLKSIGGRQNLNLREFLKQFRLA